jgi:nicotinic acid mononucleotide adenylyltransferase
MQNRHNSALCNVLHLPLTPNALSSTAVRLAFAKKNQNQSAQRLLDQALEPRVLRYIANHSLYL